MQPLKSRSNESLYNWLYRHGWRKSYICDVLCSWTAADSGLNEFEESNRLMTMTVKEIILQYRETLVAAVLEELEAVC